MLLQEKTRGFRAFYNACQHFAEGGSADILEYFLTHFPHILHQMVEDEWVSLTADVCSLSISANLCSLGGLVMWNLNCIP